MSRPFAAPRLTVRTLLLTSLVAACAQRSVSVDPAQAQQPRVTFGADGTFQVGPFTLQTAAAQHDTRPGAEGQAADIVHGDSIEHLRTIENGVHQTFSFASKPTGPVRIAVRGGEYRGETVTGHHFASPGAELTYGPATWISADGRHTPLPTRYENGELIIDVPEEPGELDPIISIRTNLVRPVLGAANRSQMREKIAFDGTNYLVVWQDNRKISGHLTGVHGARVTPSGTVLDIAGLSIFEDIGNTTPGVSFDGTNYVVVATDSRGNVLANRVTPGGAVLDGPNGRRVDQTYNSVEILDVATGQLPDAGRVSLIAWTNFIPGSGNARARLVGGDLTPLGAQLALSTSNGDQVPKVAFNGTDFLVAWRENQTSPGNVRATRVSGEGIIRDNPPLSLGVAGRAEVAVGAVGSTFLVAWRTQNDVVAAVRVSGAGALLDTTPLVLSGTAPASSAPTVAGDGATFRVSWLTYVNATTTNLYSNRVTPAGAALDGTGLSLGNVGGGSPADPSTACSSAMCLIGWTAHYDIFATRVQGTTRLDATPIWASTSPNEQNEPQVARSGNQYLVVWEDLRTGFVPQIWAARVTPTGTVLDQTGIDVCSMNDEHHRPVVAGGPSGEWFVAWTDGRASRSDLYGTRVLADGSVVTPCGAKLTTTGSANSPTIASDGTGYLLAWHDTALPFVGEGIFAAHLSAAGAVLDDPPLNLSAMSGGQLPTVTHGGGSYFVAYEKARVLRGLRVPSIGAPIDAPPGLVLGRGDGASSTFDGREWVLGFRQHDPASPPYSSTYQMRAMRVALDGGVLDDGGVRLSSQSVPGSAYPLYTDYPQAGFDGVDSVFVWSTNFESGQVRGAWFAPDGGVFGASTLVSVPRSIPLSTAIIGRGDGDHSLLVYVYGDLSAGVRQFRVGAQEITFCINGHACGSAAACKSGYFVDGVCCNTACGGGVTTDCQVCSAALGATADGVCTPLPAGRACRAANGACDVADSCDGVGGACPDAVQPSTMVCRPTVGPCDRPESCTGSSGACPADVMQPASTVCRAATGTCDVAETCTGSSATCPTDGFKPAATLCRAVAGACDVAELCTGSSGACPADVFSAPTTLCRAAAGACDVAESCSGTSATCPADVVLPASTVCRGTAGACDVPELCSGASAVCPADGLRPSGFACRAAQGPCDVGEACNGFSSACPADALRPPGFTCRGAAGACDRSEACDGRSKACPADELAPSGTTCRPAAGSCDVAEVCSGTAATCPADERQAAGFVCRAEAGACDVSETCDGRASACPADAFRPAGFECRPAATTCDAAERCTGSGAMCATDTAAPDGTVCGETRTCTSSQVCRSGQCVASNAPPPCDDHDECTADSCVEGTGCAHAAIAGCCSAASACDDADVCTIDSCERNACRHGAIANCCRADSDCDDARACTTDRCTAGVCLNAVTASCSESPPPSGCGCGSTEATAVVLGLGALARRRRRA